MLNITELLNQTLEIDTKHICLNITTITDIYTLCFIEYEDTDKIGVYMTHDDGRERFMIIRKEHIVSLQVVYENDIKVLLDIDESSDIMVV